MITNKTIKLPPKDKLIHVSGRIWHELYPKVNPSLFLYAFRKGIDLSKYGDGVSKYYFTFIVEKLNPTFDASGTYFDGDTNVAEIAVEIPYNKVLVATKEETIKLMEQAYLKGIDLIATLPLKSDFDVVNFKKDVENIFSNADWYKTAMA
ncbi:MAG: hypothetical protein DHS20C18_11020 [Saprospiraceae bacterium]|nr:MAG: hypothetical protein DHS20C18_11020 [Saprospiraceae bacterium]